MIVFAVFGFVICMEYYLFHFLLFHVLLIGAVFRHVGRLSGTSCGRLPLLQRSRPFCPCVTSAVGVMAWLDKCSPRMQSLIREGCPWALESGFNEPENEQRHLDFFEMYSGAGHLNAMVGKASSLRKASLLVGLVLFEYHVFLLYFSLIGLCYRHLRARGRHSAEHFDPSRPAALCLSRI